MSTVTEIPEDVTAAVASVSKRLRARYRNYVEYEDVQQELYYWYLKRGHRKLAQWEEEYDHPKSVQRLLSKALWNAGDKYCRAEKAAAVGYEEDDEFFYTIPMVADMLTLHFDPEWMYPTNTVDDNGSSNKKPPQEGWNLQAMVADVGRAYQSLPDADRELLAFVYDGSRVPRDAIAWLSLDWKITHNAADHRVRRVLGRIRAKLGGPRPYKEEA